MEPAQSREPAPARTSGPPTGSGGAPDLLARLEQAQAERAAALAERDKLLDAVVGLAQHWRSAGSRFVYGLPELSQTLRETIYRTVRVDAFGKVDAVGHRIVAPPESFPPAGPADGPAAELAALRAEVAAVITGQSSCSEGTDCCCALWATRLRAALEPAPAPTPAGGDTSGASAR